MLATVIVPVFISLIGRKRSLCFGGILQAIYLFTYVNPVPELYYIFSAIAGVGSSFIWITMGTEIGVNSTNETAHRNTCIYWAFFMSGNLFGNIFVFFTWAGHDHVNETLQLSTTLLSGFISLFGSFLFLFLKELPEEEIREDKTTKDLAIEYFKSIDVVRDWRVQSIIPMACMFAIEQSFFTSIYPTCIGANKDLGFDSIKFIGLSAFFVTIGELLGAGLQMISVVRLYRGYSLSFVSFLFLGAISVCFIMLPNECTISSTPQSSLVTPKVSVLMLTSVIIGIYDSTASIIGESILCTFFDSERDTAGCFVVFNLSFGLAQFSCFMYTSYITLWNQILINMIFLLLSLISFTRLDLFEYRNKAK